MILGTGPIGCWQAVMARDRGAGRVWMTDVSRERLDIALERRSASSSTTRGWRASDNGVEEVLARTDGHGAERVSVAAPAKPAQQAALEMAAKRARVVYFAGLPKHDPVSPLDMNQLHYKELAILGAYGATHRQYRITMDYLDRRREDLAGRGDAPVPAGADRRGVRDDPVGRRAEDGRSSRERPVRHRLRRRQPGDELRAVRRRRNAGGVGVRGATTCRSRTRRGPSRTPTSGSARSNGRSRGSSPRCRRARRRSRGCRSDRSSTGWSSCDAGGRPVRPAMIWMDRRAEEQSAALAEGDVAAGVLRERRREPRLVPRGVQGALGARRGAGAVGRTPPR